MSAKICHRKAVSNTGLVGISETRIRGYRCFSVSWRPAPYRKKSTTFYFTAPTRAAVLAEARAFRTARIAERAAQEGAVRP